MKNKKNKWTRLIQIVGPDASVANMLRIAFGPLNETQIKNARRKLRKAGYTVFRGGFVKAVAK